YYMAWREVFQSSPAPKGGSHQRSAVLKRWSRPFQSSPAPKGGSHLSGGGRGRLRAHVSILSRPEGREPRRDAWFCHTHLLIVSILSRPEGREPRRDAWFCHTHLLIVSILSRPEGREPQHGHQAVCDERSGFQSSPAPKGGSHGAKDLAQPGLPPGFNPLPPRRAGATWPIRSSKRPRPRFNPLPPRRAGATRRRCGAAPRSGPLSSFNPLPPRRAGA